jgi:thiamine-phosphate pyrophosphorylase
VIDANLNRLREALRVIEEYVRFIDPRPETALEIKRLRHELPAIEQAVGRQNLLAHRDTASDPFAELSQPSEMNRQGVGDVVTASFKRGQEAARVIEEYGKIAPFTPASATAKSIRFRLYALEKEFAGRYYE